MAEGHRIAEDMQRDPGYGEWLAAVRGFQKLNRDGIYRILFFLNQVPVVCRDGDVFYDGGTSFVNAFLLNVVSDGEEALAYLRQEGLHRDAPRPDLILLDLNLPRRDGREVLEEIKKDDVLGRIPVVVLTTSAADEDILRSYQLHANAYVTKPVDFERFITVIRQIDEFFVSVVKLPPRA